MASTASCHILKVQLQIGTKLRECNFPLQARPISYPEWLELVLSEVEAKLGRSQQENHPYFVEMQQLKQANEKLRREVGDLGEKLMKAKLANNLMQASYEELLRAKMDLEIELSKLRVQQVETEGGHSEGVSDEGPEEHSHLAGQSSAIDEYFVCKQPAATPIEVDESETFLEGVKPHQKFILDSRVNLNDPDTFLRVEQRIRLRHEDLKPRQFNSMAPLPAPTGFVNFRLLSTRSHNIYAGVLLARRNRERSTRREAGAMSYQLRGGRSLWEDGVKVGAGVEQIAVGDVLTLLVERRKGVVKWFRNGKLMLKRSLQVSFVDQDLFPFVTMIHQGDEVEFV